MKQITPGAEVAALRDLLGYALAATGDGNMVGNFVQEVGKMTFDKEIHYTFGGGMFTIVP